MSRVLMEACMWIILASLVVLVIMNPKGFVGAVSVVGTQTNDLVKTLSGSNYGRAAA